MKKFLTENKIYFETIASASLIIASIVVSFFQWRASVRQTEIALSQQVPIFEIRTVLTKAEGEADYSDDQLIVANRGGAAREPGFECTTWLQIDVEKDRVARKFSIPLLNYYPEIQLPNGKMQDELFTASGGRNLKDYAQLSRAIRTAARARGMQINLSIRRFATIRYKDPLGDSIREYFEVIPAYGARALDPGKGGPFFSLTRDALHFREDSPDEAVNLIERLFFSPRNAIGG